MPEDSEERRQRQQQEAESVFQRIRWLESQGWSNEDASRYVELHQIWLRTDLLGSEEPTARQLEKKYGALENFGIFRDQSSSQEPEL
ncbi:MAG: hypothetical protein AAB402_03515 [Patescibacteria group bacterium]